jgi:hypothetical protein
MFKTIQEKIRAKYLHVCHKPQLRSALEGKGEASLGAPGLTHKLHFTAFHFRATTGTQWSQCYMQQTMT